MGERVLIIGNGFDLAHGLPTRYSDFLEFCNLIQEMKTSVEEKYLYTSEGYNEIRSKIRKFGYFYDLLIEYYNSFLQFNGISLKGNCTFMSSEEYRNVHNIINIIYGSMECNIWYRYLKTLYKENKLIGENWIDFETEIKIIIESIDRNTKTMTSQWSYILDNMIINDIEVTYKVKKFNEMLYNPGSVKSLRKILYTQLEDLTYALEKYLCFFVSCMKVQLKSPDIDAICPNYVINFNYIFTYSKIYNYYTYDFHVHGHGYPTKAKEDNKMVLGIDEYWSEEERDKHTDFTIFKKFAQRIQKRTGIENYKWFDEIKADYDEHNELAEIFIFGHSLDVTDKDILYNYLESEATDVTIYCKDEETEGEYIANVIKIIGEKRLLEKVNQDPPKLKFVIQRDMVPIKEEELSTSGAAT